MRPSSTRRRPRVYSQIVSNSARLRLLAAALAPALVSGCLQPSTDQDSTGPPAAATVSDAAALFPQAADHSRSSDPLPTIHLVILAMDVVRVELTADDVRDARKVWNHVDELRLGAEHSVLLARNGLRMAVGSSAAWPAIRAIVDTAKAVVEQETLISEANMPLSLTLGHTSDGESVFVHLGPGRLTGKSFPVAEKLLKLDYRARPEAGSEIDLRLGFEIREDLGVMSWEKINGTIREVPAYNRHTFEDLDTLVTLKPDEFLVIGLGEGIERSNSLGNRFLTADRSGRLLETLLFLTPRLMERQSTATGAAGLP